MTSADETRQRHRAQALLGRFKNEPFSDWFCDYHGDRRSDRIGETIAGTSNPVNRTKLQHPTTLPK
jgi:hypothetical protein